MFRYLRVTVLEAEQLAVGGITQQHIAVREVLRTSMHHGGFRGIPTEWWHFNHGDAARVRREFVRVE